MKKQLNVRLVAIVLGCLIVLGVGTHFLHAYQVQRNAHSLLDLASAAEERGRIDDAARYLGLYVGLCPEDTGSLARMGELLADERMAKTGPAKFRALTILNKVLQRDPGRDDVRRAAAKLSIELGRFTDARVDLENHLLKANPKDGELQFLLARCYESTADYKSAREWYEKSVQNAPKNVDAYLRLAALLRQREPAALYGDATRNRATLQDDADKVIENMVGANPTAFRAYLSRAAYRRNFQLKDQDTQARIAQDIAAAQKLAGDEVEVILAASDLAREEKQFDAGRKLLQRGCEIHSNDWRLYKALARLETSDGKRAEAVDCLKQGLQGVPNQPDLLWDLAENQIELGQRVDAAKTIDQLSRAGIPPAFRDCLSARLEMAEGRWADAARRLETAFFALNDLSMQRVDTLASPLATQAGLMLGTCYEKRGDTERALRAYGRVNARNPQSLAALIGMARCSFALGKLQDALDQYQQVLRLPDATAAALVEIARITLVRNLERPDADLHWAEVEAALARARKPFVDKAVAIPPELILIEAEAKAARKQFDTARQILQGPYGDPASRPSIIWVGLASLETSQGRPESALSIVEQAKQHVGDKVELRITRARALAAQKTPESKAAIAQLAENTDQFSEDDRARLIRSLAVASLQAGDLAASVRLWERFAQAHPGDIACRMMLFDLAADAGNAEAMEKWQRELKSVEQEEGVMWRYARTRMLIEQARRGDKSVLPEARHQLVAIAAKRPDWSRAVLCEALIDDLSGQMERAVGNYLRAIKLGAPDAFAMTRAAELMYHQGRYAEANALFSKIPVGSLPEAVRQAAADSALQAGVSARAMDLAQLAVPSDSKDYRRQIWLGWMYWRAREQEKAKAAFLKARELAEDKPEPWMALVLYLADNNQMDAARAEVEAAESKLKGPEATLALANCNAAIGKVDRAEALFREALSARPDDPNTLRAAADFHMRTGKSAEAQSNLRKLIAVTRTSSPETFAAARRTLAYLLTLDGDPEKSREALALFDADGQAAGNATPDAIQDRRTKAQLFALRNTREGQRAAVQILEEMLNQNQATMEDCFLAAQLEESLGDWAKSKKRFAQLLADSASSQPAQWAAAARAFLRHNQVAEATTALQLLEKKLPGAPITREIQARILHGQGKSEDARAIVMQIAKSSDAELPALASLMSEFGDPRAAEELLRRFVAQSKKPESVFVLIEFLINQKRSLDALELCDRAWADCPAAAVADACLAALGRIEENPSAFQRVESQLQAAIAKNPNQVELQTALGTVWSLQGRYDDAIAQYRRVLEKNPRAVSVLNNLAWLLALKGGNKHEALTFANLAVDVSGQNPGMIDTRAVAAMAYGAQDAVEQAIRDLELLVSQAPSATAYFHLAQAYVLGNRRRDAVTAWQRADAMGLKPNDLHPLERPAYEKIRGDLGNLPPR